jgi:hypothetical protein
MGIREDNIKAAIQNLSGGTFERFAFRVLREEEYPGLNPTSESHDLGEDARTEPTSLFLHHGKWVSVSTSKIAELSKLRKDCERARETGRRIDIIVFATSGEVRRDTEEKWREEIKNDFGWDLVVHSIDYFAPIAARDKHASLVEDYLQIPPQGGDFLHAIEIEFERLTSQALETATTTVEGLEEPLTRTEVSTVEDQLKDGKQVLLTGEAGTGKSGIATMLARSAEKAGRGVIFLDARRTLYINSEKDFRDYFNLSGPVDGAIARVARKKGCRVIIDQFDNAVGRTAAEQLTNLARACRQIENTETIVISRKIEYHEEESLKTLLDAGFVELTSHPLTETKVLGVMDKLGVSNAPAELIDACRNLLNLSLVATIKKNQPAYDFSNTLNEIDLWEGFVGALIKKEGGAAQPNFGEEVAAEAMSLAIEGLRRDDRMVILGYPRSLAHQRLISWQVIIPEEEDIHRFRHERMQDYLVAWDAFRKGTLPSEILREFDKHRTLGVFAWIDKLYARRPNSSQRRKFLKELFTLSDVPFYALTAVLQRYISSVNPAEDQVALQHILEALRNEEGVRSYFFRSRPHSRWAHVLWEEGFFDNPPSPRPYEGRHLLPYWDEQNYLISVAADVPDLLVEHLRRQRGDSGYAEQGVRALCLIPAKQREAAVPRVLEWVLDYRIGQTLVNAVVDLIKNFIAEECTGAALELFRGLTRPHPSPHHQRILGHVMSGEAVALFSSSSGFAHKELPDLVGLLAREQCQEVIVILEEHLLEAVRIEARTRELSDEYVWDVWDNPLAEVKGFGRDEYKNILLRLLRKTLERWIENDADAVQHLIEKYLDESRSQLESRFILRRLGVHLLQKYSAHYKELVRRELLEPENLNTLAPPDEFLMLIQKGHQYLSHEEQEALISNILRGLPPDIKAQFGRKVEREDATEQDTYTQCYEKKWIRDHLAQLKDSLPEGSARMLMELIEEVGEPITPDRPRVVVHPDHASEVSPITKERMDRMSPDEVIDFVRNWQPAVDEDGAAYTSYDVLAHMIADEMLTNPTKYEQAIKEVALIRHQYAAALIMRLTNTERYPLSWEGRIALCESLLRDATVRKDMTDSINDGWKGVRLSVVRLIATWIDKKLLPIPKEYLPSEYLPRVREILVLLCDDPDAEQNNIKHRDESNRKEVSLIAHGHVRPSALSTLIIYAEYKANLEYQPANNEQSGVSYTASLEHKVRDILTLLLEKHSGTNLLLHSVFGEHISRLRWLDRHWVDANLDLIFPETDDEQLRWCYVAAWDAFLNYNHRVDLNLFEQMRGKYARAVENLKNGYVTRTSSQPERDLACHLLTEYLHASYDLLSEVGQQSLIANYFKQLSPTARGDGAWVLWDICNKNRARLENYWNRALTLWYWRVTEASRADHATDFDDELNWFALMLKLASKRGETLSSMWALLEGMLPHIARSDSRNVGWDEVEAYLSKEVERDPARAIKLYHMMIVERKDSLWMFHPHHNGHKIVRTALSSSPEAGYEALEMINFLGRHGHYHFHPHLQ